MKNYILKTKLPFFNLNYNSMPITLMFFPLRSGRLLTSHTESSDKSSSGEGESNFTLTFGTDFLARKSKYFQLNKLY